MSLPKSRPSFPAKMPSSAQARPAPVQSPPAKPGTPKNIAAPFIFQRATGPKAIVSSGIGLGQTISKPNVVARMIELLRQGCTKDSKGRIGRVLEIGTGCGYQAALLAQVCSEVYSIERLRGLHDKARDHLRPFAIAHLHLLLGDGMLGYAKGAPFAGIIAAAGGDAIPQAWVDQLAVGGRLVAPMVTTGGTQALIVLDKTQQGVTQSVLEAVHFVPLKSGVM